MEYTASTLAIITPELIPSGSLTTALGNGLQLKTDSVAFTNMTPLFTMPAGDFATLRTWYGEGQEVLNTVTQQAATWNSPG